MKRAQNYLMNQRGILIDVPDDEASDAFSDEFNDPLKRYQNISKSAKICSFSARNDSILMWSHYADNHRGFCIEYDIEVLSEDHAFRRNLYPINYTSQLYDLTFQLLKMVPENHPELNPSFPLLGIIHKYTGWSYEEEWRFVKAFKQPMPDLSENVPVPSRVFLGAKMGEECSREILAVCKQMKIEVCRMRLADNSFDLLTDPFD